MTEYANRHTHKVCIIRMRETYQQEANKVSQTEAYKGYQSVRSVIGAMHLLSDFPKFVDFLFFFLSLFISSHLGTFQLHKDLMYLPQKFHVFFLVFSCSFTLLPAFQFSDFSNFLLFPCLSGYGFPVHHDLQCRFQPVKFCLCDDSFPGSWDKDRWTFQTLQWAARRN